MMKNCHIRMLIADIVEASLMPFVACNVAASVHCSPPLLLPASARAANPSASSLSTAPAFSCSCVRAVLQGGSSITPATAA